MIITITGRMGSGKNSVLELLKVPQDYVTIDVDALAHELLAEEHVIKKIGGVFPGCVVDGIINRKKLAELVFPDNTEELNRIVHPYLVEAIHSHLHPKTIINSALPKELKLLELSDLIITVEAEDDVIKKRLQNKFSFQDIENRLRIQESNEWYKKVADIVIRNNGTLEELKKEILKKCKNLF